MMEFSGRLLVGMMAMAVAGLAYAGPEDLPPAAGVGAAPGTTEGSIEVVGPTPAPGIPYYEYFHYSAYAKRSYVPGYTPHVTSLFENPRDYPWALCVLANPYYQYAGTPGWFFGSPQGYQSSVPEGSHAAKYFRGELGITEHLRGGYPQGLRVVEPAIVPVGNSSERGGVYIHGGGVQTVDLGIETEVTETVTERIGPPAPVPGPAPTPASLEK